MLKMMKMDFNTRVGSFCVDTAEEVKKLPTLNSPGQDNLNTVYCAGMGSECLVLGDESVYVLNGSNKWVKFGSGSGSDAVLNFLPHPEGVYAYWDYNHGVENFTWADMVNNAEIKEDTNNANFVVENGWLHLNKGQTSIRAKLPIKNQNFVIYILCQAARTIMPITNFASNYILFSSSNPYIVDIRIAHLSKGNALIPSYEVGDICCLSLICTESTVRGFGTNNSNDFGDSSIITSTFGGITYMGIADVRSNYKAILLSDNILNVDHIKENMAALWQHYS